MTDSLKAITLGLVILEAFLLGIWFHSLWIRGGRQ
jgi:hypothetical protein